MMLNRTALQAHVLHYICSQNARQAPKKLDKLGSPDSNELVLSRPSFTVDPDAHVVESCEIVSTLYENFKGKAAEQVIGGLSLLLISPLVVIAINRHRNPWLPIVLPIISHDWGSGDVPMTWITDYITSYDWISGLRCILFPLHRPSGRK